MAGPEIAIEQLVDGLDHPEGVAYDPDADVVWAGGEDGQIYRVELAERSWVEVARAPGLVLGLAVLGTALDHFPNGCAVSPDGDWLWTVES